MVKINHLFIILIIAFLFLVNSCANTEETELMCHTPYIEYKSGECCLDQNNNSICDKDENIKPQEADGEVRETEDNQPSVTTKKISNLSYLLEDKCDEFPSVAIGYRGCTRSARGDITITIGNLGSSSLVGLKYYLQDVNDQAIGLVDEKEIKTEILSGDEASINLPEFITKYPYIERIQIRPIAKVNGFDTVCTNHHVILMPANNCR